MPTVYTEAAAGGGRVYLDVYGQVSQIRYESTYPGGASTASWVMDAPHTLAAPGVRAGRRVGILAGTETVWRGKLDEPVPGNGWEMSATGLGAESKDYTTAVAGNGYALDAQVDGAIGRGLRWTRPASLPSADASFVEEQAKLRIDEALTAVADKVGQVWSVSRTGALTMGTPPTAHTFLLLVDNLGGARSLDEFSNAVYTKYLSNTTNVNSLRPAATDDASIAVYGRIERVLDITGLGPTSYSAADAAGKALLGKVGASLSWTGEFSVSPGDLLTRGGVPVHLASADVVGRMVRLLLTTPPDVGGVRGARSVEFIVGHQSYDAEKDVLTLRPRESSRRDLSSMLSPQKEAV